ncbi:substrate-binding periplasmic protein [Dongshaea marina]|uniref:substrate-binding periplasmic protein n=1 Tax=Dongshaea marina TaxID=2047966 RepID=UPI000D3E766E|nr:transporter substrate-binding domain-containing protein [Dongshaea marina]
MKFTTRLAIGLLCICLFSLKVANGETILKIATDDWPPYEFYDEQQNVTGFSSEMLTEVLSRMKLIHMMKARYNRITIYPWAKAEQMVFNGKLDILYSASPSENRHRYCYLPDEPIIKSPWVFFIRKQDEARLNYQSFDSLKEHRVGVVRGYSYTPQLWDFLRKHSNYKLVNTDQQAFTKLALGRFDYIISELYVGLSIMKEMEISHKLMPITDKPIKETGLYYLFSKKTMSPEFVAEFSSELKKFKTTSAYQKLYQKYFGGYGLSS